MAPSLVSVGPLPPPMAVAVAVRVYWLVHIVFPLNYRPRSLNPGWSLRVTRLRRKAEEARRHKSQDHLWSHARPARGGGFGTAVKMRAEDTSIAQAELDVLP
jgi:hypothetical protein